MCLEIPHFNARIYYPSYLITDTAQVGTNVIKFELSTPDEVLARVYEGSTRGKLISTIYYKVERAICTFCGDIYKRKLLNSFHGMLRREENGYKSSQIGFSILPKKILGSDYFFNIVSTDDGSPRREETIMFKDIFSLTAVSSFILLQKSKKSLFYSSY